MLVMRDLPYSSSGSTTCGNFAVSYKFKAYRESLKQAGPIRKPLPLQNLLLVPRGYL